MNLTGDQIKDTYGALLNIGASGATGTLQPVTDGFGNVLPFEVSTTTINFTGTVTGITGAGGTSGTSGTSGVSGSSGTSGTSGSNGTSGTSGANGTSGTSGTSGSNGTSGTSGADGTSGTSGVSGTSGTSGTSGADGTSGTSGVSGTSGTSGTSGVNGATGPGASSPITLETTNNLVSTAIGATAQGAISNSIVIGAGAYSTASCSVAIGNGAFSCGANSVSIGNAVCNYANNNVAIGNAINGYDNSRNYSVAIGNSICHTQETTSIGSYINNGTYRGIAIGYQILKSAGGASRSVKLGQYLDTHTDESPIQIGVCNTSCSNWSIQIGENNTFAATTCVANYSSAIGYGNTNCHTCSSILGVGITTVKANAAHVNNLIALGQGASLVHDNGSVTGTATVNWDNSNNQTLTLTGSTTITFSNPVAGANYMIEVTQGGSGSYTITWPTIKWAFNNPPVLTTAVGGIDVINLFYDGTNYLGTFALNFV